MISKRAWSLRILDIMLFENDRSRARRRPNTFGQVEAIVYLVYFLFLWAPIRYVTTQAFVCIDCNTRQATAIVDGALYDAVSDVVKTLVCTGDHFRPSHCAFVHVLETTRCSIQLFRFGYNLRHIRRHEHSTVSALVGNMSADAALRFVSHQFFNSVRPAMEHFHTTHSAFNQDAFRWDTSAQEPARSAFNHDVGSWDTSAVDRASFAFNQDVDRWVTSDVDRATSAFNQHADISDTSAQDPARSTFNLYI